MHIEQSCSYVKSDLSACGTGSLSGYCTSVCHSHGVEYVTPEQSSLVCVANISAATPSGKAFEDSTQDSTSNM